MNEISEGRLEAGEGGFVAHDHEGVDITEGSLVEHLSKEHDLETPDGLSFGALAGMHDRFHGEAHAIDGRVT